MNRKYMDFVPGNPQRTRTVGRKQATAKPRPQVENIYGVVRETSHVSKVRANKPLSENNLKTDTAKKIIRGKRTASSREEAFAGATLGVVEDLGPKFVKTNVPKRPLSRAHFKVQSSEISQIKAKKVGIKGDDVAETRKTNTTRGKKTGLLVEKPVEKYNVPKTPFINQDKVQKRPLSKNVYSKKIIPVKEEPKGPVTIIAKPEKESRVGLVVTIVVTIILGAVAGTVAFLLLPK